MAIGRRRRRDQPAWLRDPLWARARMVPSLDLRFAVTQSLLDVISGKQLVTFTRASNGTRVNGAGTLETLANDVPRITFDPTTGRCLGLLVEEARTNLLLRSEEFDNASWVKARASVSANATTAPDGTTTADRLTEDTTASNTHQVSQSYTFTATSHTINVFAKPDSRVRFRVVVSDGTTTFSSYYNVSSGVADNTLNGTAAMQQLANGWWRCLFTFTPVAAAGSVQFRLAPASGSEFYTGDGTSGLFLWGAQLEAGAFPTSYLRTEGSQATRAADIATNTSGINFNAIRAMYAEFQNPASGTRGVVSLNDNTANERIALNTSGTDPLLLVVDGGVTQASVDAGSFTANTRTRVAARFNTNDFAVSMNGGQEVIDTSGTMPTLDRLMIGRSQAGEYLNGPLARLILWDRAPYSLPELT